MIARAGACWGDTGNVIKQDDTELVSAACTTYVPPTLVRNNNILETELDDSIPNLDSSSALLIDNILLYIAGFVVRRALKKISCEDCCLVLTDNETVGSKFVLINARNEGGLIFPSKGVISIITSAEEHIRENSCINRPSRQLTNTLLGFKVLSEIGNRNLFNFEDHIQETRVGIDNHFFCIVRTLVDIYFTVRQHHIVNLYNLQNKKKVLRHKLTKAILFLGQ